MTVRTRNRLIAFSIMAGPFIFLLCLILFWNAEPLPPLPAMPNPNGYDSLVKAGNMVSNDFDDYDELSSTKLQELINKDVGALQLARTGLRQECRVTIDYSPNLGAHFNELPSIKHLAFAFEAEGKLAEMENRTNDAIGFYLDLGRLANQSSRGGILIDELVSVAIEAMEVDQLQKFIDRLDARTCREIVTTLETLDSQRQTWDQVMQQEHNWARRSLTGIRYRLIRLLDHGSQEEIFQKAEHNYNKQQHQTRQLILDFAARAYTLDKDYPPASVNDLVPVYLKTIPQDPFTGTNMVYSPR